MLVCQFTAEEAAADETDIVPLVHAHAHNDYHHDRPLLDALAHGFCGVEADIHLVNGQLLVAHDREDCRPENTLEALYLSPLHERCRQNGGRVYPDGPSLTLLIDIKSEGVPTYKALRDVLANYAEILTKFREGNIDEGAVTVIISGNRPQELMRSEPHRLAAVDGRFSDVDSDISRSFMPLISDNWRSHFSWRGASDMPLEERQKLHAIVKACHARGQRVRLWATPESEAVWQALREAGVDLLNTDDLPRLREFLLRDEAGSR